MLIGCSYDRKKRRCFSSDIDIDIYARKCHFSSTEKRIKMEAKMNTVVAVFLVAVQGKLKFEMIIDQFCVVL